MVRKKGRALVTPPGRQRCFSPVMQGSSNDCVNACWNTSSLVRVEGALHIHLMSTGRGGGTLDGPKRMPLDTFYSLTKKLGLASEVQPASTVEHLSQEERLLYDFLCAASPDLYRLCVDPQKRHSLEVIPSSGNRIEQLRQLADTPYVSRSKCTDILEAILAHRDSKKNKEKIAASTVAKQKAEVTAEPHIRPDMNLEQRVRARADAQERKRLKSNETDKVDRRLLLKLADALWSHSRHVMNRQSQMQSLSKRNTNEQQPCVMTVKDVMKHCGASLQFQTKTGALKEDKEAAERLQLVQSLQELQRLVPEWITLMDPSNESAMPEKATVWIKPIEYQSTRARISGTKGNEAKAKPAIGKRASPDSSSRTFNLLNRNMSQDNDEITSRATVSPEDTPVSSLKLDSPPPAHKKLRLLPVLAGKKRRGEGHIHQHHHHHGGSPKKRRGLRINEHLILTDADYSGGEILQPSGASPRGLKTLFLQLKEGKRI